MSQKLICTNCSVSDVPLLACGRCKGVQYCSRNCQKQHWTAGRHSSQCVAFTTKPKIVDQESEIPETFIGPTCSEKKQKLMCANCSDFNVSLMRCQCQLVLYCSHECQKQHWHEIHKTQCTMRKPEIPITFKRPIGNEKVKCRICHTAIEKEACVLPCGHKFHISCVDGVSLKCPICHRVSAWEDAKKAHENCYRRYITMKLANSTRKTTNDTSLLQDWIVVAKQGYPDAMFMVGRLYYMDNNVFEAKRWFCKLGNHTNALTNLGFIKSHQGDVKGAIEYYKEAIKVDPKNVSPHFNLGLCMLKVEKLTEEEKLTEAIKCFREVIRLDPDHADGNYNLGWALWNSSYYMGAVAAFKRTLRLDPGHEKASHMLKEIENIDWEVVPDSLKSRFEMAKALM